MTDGVTDDYVAALIDLGGFLIDFAKVMRATHLDREGTPESDTDHTVMLAVMACAIAARLHPDYDLGKVAQYALVHDLVEVYSGDINTINFHSVDKNAKVTAEKAALQKIKLRFAGHFEWIHKTINEYERLQDSEARFVKTLDKVMPAISQHYSSNKVINEKFTDPEAFEASMEAINKDMANTYAHDQQIALQLRRVILKEVISNKYAHHGKKMRT